MTSEKQVRAAEQIHLGDGKYLDKRAIEMEWYGDETEDDLDTLARLRFKVSQPEYVQMAKLGLVDSDASEEETEQTLEICLRTDRDLVDEAEEQLQAEWEDSLEDAGAELEIWNDLDYWEVESVN